MEESIKKFVRYVLLNAIGPCSLAPRRNTIVCQRSSKNCGTDARLGGMGDPDSASTEIMETQKCEMKTACLLKIAAEAQTRLLRLRLTTHDV